MKQIDVVFSLRREVCKFKLKCMFCVINVINRKFLVSAEDERKPVSSSKRPDKLVNTVVLFPPKNVDYGKQSFNRGDNENTTIN